MDFKAEFIVGIAGCYALILAVGVWASRAKESNSSAESLFLAGRQLPLLVGVFTMIATWVGGGFINGTAEAVFSSGLIWCQAPWGYAMSLLIGGLFFAEKMRDAGYATLLDPFERRYGPQLAAVLFIPALIGEVFWSAAILMALGTTVGTIFGLDFQTSIIVSATIAVSYTFLGGLWSVAYTDVPQLLLIIVGLGLVIPFAMDRVGGLDDLVTAYRDQFAGASSLFPQLRAFVGDGEFSKQAWKWLDMALLLMLGGIPWGVYFQRVLSCPSGKVAKRLSIMAALGCLLMAIPPMLIGAVGATVDWSATAAPGIPEGPMVLPYVLRYLTPKFVAVLGVGAVAAAVMSSVDSSVLSASSMFVWNVYRPLLRRNAEDKELMRVTKVSVLLVGVLATWLALSVRSVYDLWFFCSDIVYVVLFPQLVTALYLKGVTRKGALYGLAVGLILRIGGGVSLLGIPAFIPYPMQEAELGLLFPFRTTAMLASLITIWLVSRLSTASAPQSIERRVCS